MSGKRNASEAAADEPESKVAKLVDDPKPEADPGAKPAADGAAPVAPAGDPAKDKAQAEPGGGEGAAADRPDAVDEQGDGDDVEVTDKSTKPGDAPPARRSLRARNPVRKARIQGTTNKGVEAKIAQVQYKEGELLSEHLKQGDGSLLEVKIPAECTVSSNLQVRTRQLWGTDVYTSDSDLVAVLMHTGYYLPSLTISPSLLEGCSYKVESCRAVTVNGTSIDLEPSPGRVTQVVPTFFPNNVESVVNTRSQRGDSERRQRLIQEVTVQYNLCNEPWLKYSIAAVADQGFKRSQWTAARLRRESLYLETHGQRFELSFEGNGETAAAAASSGAEGARAVGEGGSVGEDTYRWARCKKPLPLASMRQLGIPLPKEHVEEVKAGLKWDDIKWGSASVDVAGTEVDVVRLHFLSRT